MAIRARRGACQRRPGVPYVPAHVRHAGGQRRVRFFPQRWIDHRTAFRAAKEAIGPKATEVLLWVYEDQPLRWIQQQLRLGCHRTAARRVAEHATVLALHYEEVDKARGRSSTPFTKEAAIRSVDPDDPEP